MGLLTREQILSADDLAPTVVAVPEWGGEVRVRGLTGAERDAFEAALFMEDGKRRRLNLVNVRAKLVAMACIDEKGGRLFTEADAEALGQKSGLALTRVADCVQKLSGLTDEDVQELVGN